MFEDAVIETTEGLEALMSALGLVGTAGSVGDGAVSGDASPDQERIDQLAALERVKAAVAAAQVRVTAAFVDSQEQVAQQWRERARACSDAGDFEGWRAARQQARAGSVVEDDGAGGAGAPEAGSSAGAGQAGAGQVGAGGDATSGAGGSGGRRRRRPSGMTGVAAQVALARRESPVQGASHVHLALALTRDMPHTLAVLESGELSEWRAQIIVRETATLTREDRRLVDAEVVGDPRQPVGMLGDRELARRVRAVAYRVDAASVLARATRAQADRRVTIRPAPDTMAYVTALLPVAQAVATHAALTVAADAARAGGDERGKGQLMADTLVERVTGQATAESVPVEVQLVMTAEALLAGDDTPAQLRGYGTVPAQWARDLLTPPSLPGPAGDSMTTDSAGVGHDGLGRGASDAGADTGFTEAAGAREARVWLRRLFTHPVTGVLVAMDSTRRTFDGGLRRFLLARDAGTCRTPWCDAPARHLDHVHDHADGGPTSAANGQGLCVRCNLTKQLPGFTAATVTGQEPGAPHTVVTTTPTGHVYSSTAPPLLPGLPPPSGPADARQTLLADELSAPPDVPDEVAGARDLLNPDVLNPDLLDPDSLSPFERVLALALAA